MNSSSISRARRSRRATDYGGWEVAAGAGFSDQSHFSHHFKRIVGVTPRQFRTSARFR
jgi:AraC family transcriptional regulator